MLQPETPEQPHTVKHHEFSAAGFSGVVLYSIDQGPMVELSFSREVQLTIWVVPPSDTKADLLSKDSTCSTGTECETQPSHVDNRVDMSGSECAEAKPMTLAGTSRVTGNNKPLPVVASGDQRYRQTRGKSSRIQRKRVSQSERPKLITEIPAQETLSCHENASGDTVRQSVVVDKSEDEEVVVNANSPEDCSQLEIVDGVCVDEAGVTAADNETKLEMLIKCQYCHRVFASRRDFYDHRRSEGSSHRCSVCGKMELFEANLIVHMRRHEKLEEDDSKSPDESGLKSEADLGACASKTKPGRKERVKCNICGLVVSSLDSLKIHTMLHTGENPYRCCVCGLEFSSLSSRQHHMDTHVTVDRFRCVQCNLRFPSRAELAKHQLTHQFECSLCGEVFPNKTSRTCHFRVAHPHDILRCDHCPALFSCEESLQRHKLYHTRGLKQQCPVCGIVVSRLKEHMLLHASSPQSRMFVCDQCPMSYHRKANLDRHMRTHTGEKPYACSHCPKRFSSNGMLRKHLLTHTQERPFQCEVCGKRCALRSNLMVHMRVHNADRRFSCSVCGQTFNHKNSLHGHIRSKHSSQPLPGMLVSGGDSLTSKPSQVWGVSTTCHQSIELGPGPELRENRPDCTQQFNDYSSSPRPGDSASMVVSLPAQTYS
ncbi:zinc finger protein [Elysia marginata]|uniref:Zinc finger protein n=1 Tax=Elysia marginata TaxID=1093978 RepID=A0AAV4EC46_9GAST|nr:zinc finger protein [Elysia marginata]